MVLHAHENTQTHAERITGEMHGPNKFSILNRQVFCFIPFTHTICNFIVLIVSRSLRVSNARKIMMMGFVDIIFFLHFMRRCTIPRNTINNRCCSTVKTKIKTNTKFVLNWQKSVKSTKSLSWILLHRPIGEWPSAARTIAAAVKRCSVLALRCILWFYFIFMTICSASRVLFTFRWRWWIPYARMRRKLVRDRLIPRFKHTHFTSSPLLV